MDVKCLKAALVRYIPFGFEPLVRSTVAEIDFMPTYGRKRMIHYFSVQQ